MNNKNFNLPNTLTVLRVVLVPFFIFFLFNEDDLYRLIAFFLFLIASLTDLVDGYLARKWRQETEFGKFLDPLADKILVISSFVTFILLDEQIELWMVLLIILRDMLITTLRYIGIKQGQSIRTTMMGKVKTAFQMGAIVIILVLFVVVSSRKRNEINFLYHSSREAGKNGFLIAWENLSNFMLSINHTTSYDFNLIDSIASFLPYFIMLITTIITVLSGIRYLATNSHLLKPSVLLSLFRKQT